MGLRLQARKEPVEVLIVDRAQQPTTDQRRLPLARTSVSFDFRQERDQLIVGRRKLQQGQRFARHPLHFLVHLRNRISRELTPEEVKLDSPLGIIVTRFEDPAADHRIDGELFAEFAHETRFE